MVKQPAVVILVRHGARLDAADKSWHLTSPAPYDPPLTYGGFNQSRALGLRIASLLEAREQSMNDAFSAPSAAHEDERSDSQRATSVSPGGSPGRRAQKRKHKVYIHSSPFQRCVQTSIGIGAGMAQFQPSAATTGRPRSASKLARDMYSASPRLRAADPTSLPQLDSVHEPMAHVSSNMPRDQSKRSLPGQRKRTKPTLRIDAFLGEWLSPDYFDLITPPPNSVLMVAGAKADLLRRGEVVDNLHAAGSASTRVPQGNLWGSARDSANTQPSTDTPLDNLRSLSFALPRRDRTNSYSSVGSHSGGARASPFRPQLQTSFKADPVTGTYIPPIPSYAVSPAEPIPKGYVAHARDACVHVDLQWESMREPQTWGDGGEYGEEWSAMHKRFRRGLNRMIDWYDSHGAHDEHEAVPEASHDDDDDDDNDNTDLVVVLVTHGAGCNALIGALTNQPVLLDVGMASLTVATLKVTGPAQNDKVISPSNSPRAEENQPPGPLRRRSSLDMGLSSYYEMKIVASSEHLRPGVDPSRASSPAAGSPILPASKTVPDSRRRFNSTAHAAAGAPIDGAWNTGEPRGSVSSALGSIRRHSAVATQPIRAHSISLAADPSSIIPEEHSPPAAPTGLWTPTMLASRGPDERKPSEDGLGLVLGSASGNNSPVVDHELPTSIFPPPPTSHPAQSAPLIGVTSTTKAHDFASPAPLAGLLLDGAAGSDHAGAVPQVASQVPTPLARTLSQKGLWGSKPRGDVNPRASGPKRRWTLSQE